MAGPGHDIGTGLGPEKPRSAAGDGSVVKPAPAPIGSPLPPDSGREPTVGTGSVVAIGCTVASLLVILLGVGVLVVLRLV